MTTADVNGERLWGALMELAEIGKTPGGGVGRLALTDDDKQARDVFCAWAKEAGLQIRVDQMGNIFSRRPGTDPDAKPVMTGSHLDTQPLGGRFDGVYGVMAGLEVQRALNDAGVKTRAPLDTAVWTDEEGARFETGMLGSAIFTDRYPLQKGHDNADANGVTMGRELERIGYLGDLPCGFPVDTYIEAHIEQGPVLETRRKQIGVVQGAQGQMVYYVTVVGEEGHAGTVPMAQRKDAMVVSARMITALNELAFEIEPQPVITVGEIRCKTNSYNTIPGNVVFSIDSRHPDADILETIRTRVHDRLRTIANEGDCAVEIKRTSYTQPSVFDPAVVQTIRSAADELGYAHQDIVSGAGHDACHLSHVVPTAMIFVPCKDGVSHNEKEDALPEDLAAGCQVLLESMVARAGLA